MRIRWRGLELPGRVTRDDTVSTDSYGRFTVEPFEQGFGTTIGNSLRRVLLSSLEGGAVTTVKIGGVAHEFATIEGVLEDVTDILLNIKGIIVNMEDDTSRTLSVERNEAGEVRAGDVVCEAGVSIANPDHLIATLTDNVPFRVDMTVRKGRGYATASDNRSAEQEVGVIPIDSVFSPVQRVRFRTEDMRVGQRTNYDRLTLEVWTDGTVAPEDAIVEAGLILRKHLNPFVSYCDMGEESVTPVAQATAEQFYSVDTETEELLNSPVAALSLSVRASNCLDAARVATIGDLVARTEADLLRVRSFGKTSLNEVHQKLAELGLRLGMKAGDGVEPVDDAATPAKGVPSWTGGSSDDSTASDGMSMGDVFPADDSATRSEASNTEPPVRPDGEVTRESGETGAPEDSEGADDPPAASDSGPMAAYTMDD